MAKLPVPGMRPLTEARIRFTAGKAYLALDQPQEALAHLRRALDVFDVHLGPGDSLALATRRDVGEALTDSGHLAEAEVWLRESLRIHEERLGVGHLDTLSAVSDLATFLAHIGLATESISLHRRALEGRQQQLGSSNPDVQNSLNNLVEFSLGCREEACGRWLDVLAHAHDWRPIELGRLHQSLGGAYEALGDVASAEMHYLVGEHLLMITLAPDNDLVMSVARSLDHLHRGHLRY